MNEELLKEINENLKKLVSYYEEKKAEKERAAKIMNSLYTAQLNLIINDTEKRKKRENNIDDIQYIVSKHWKEMRDQTDKQNDYVISKVKSMLSKFTGK